MSMTYKEICNRMEDIRDHLGRLDTRAAKEGSLLADDEKAWDDLTVEFDELTVEKRRLERAADLLRVKQSKIESNVRAGRTERGADDMDSDPLGEPDSIEDKRFKDPWNTDEIRMGVSGEARGTELRARALTAIERMQGTTDNRRETATRMVEEFDTSDGRLSQQILATSSAHYLRAFGKLAKSAGRVEVLNAEERAAVERAMSLTDSAGGYLVPFQLDPTLILTSDGSLNEIRQIAREVVATGDAWNGVSSGAVSWSFDAEAAEVSDDTTTFVQPTIPIYTARGFVPISLEAAMDESNVATEVARLLAQGKDDLEAAKFATGSGSGEPTGIVTALIASSPTVVINSATTDTFALADMYKIQGSLPARYRSRASWLANGLTYSAIRQFGTNTANEWVEGTAVGRPPQLLGKSIYEAEAMDGVVNATQDNYNLIFGDFSNYVIADRIGMTVQFVPQLFGSNRRPTGQSGWFAFYRVGADSVNDGGFRLLDVT